MTGTLHPQNPIRRCRDGSTQVVLDRHPHIGLAECLPLLCASMQVAFCVHGAAGYSLMRDVLATGHRGVWPQLGVTLDHALPTEVLDAFEATLVTVIAPYPSAIEVLTAIRAHGIATAIVSVDDEQLLQDCVDACGLRLYFDVVLSSEAARSCKPGPGMLEQATRALGAPAADTVFVGDMPELDVVGAKRMGMHTVLTTAGAGFHR